VSSSKRSAEQSTSISDQPKLTIMPSYLGSLSTAVGIADRLICTLPRALIELLREHFDDGSVGGATWAQECEWTDQAPGRQDVALWRNSVVQYPHFEWFTLRLSNPPDDAGPEEKQAFALAELAMSLKNERVARDCSVAKAYAGWLLTNAEFLAEHVRLIEDHRAEIAAAGFPFLTRDMYGSSTSSTDESKLASDKQVDVWDQFYLRWRIMGFEAPYLPLPLQPQLPVQAEVRAAALADQVGCLFFCPDIYPIPSGEELRKILEDAMRQIFGTDHLKEWKKLINVHNFAKTGIGKFARRFDVQHFARIIQQRFPTVLNRRRKGLDEALSLYLDVPEATIRGDIAELNRTLGRDWMSRRCGFELVR
jgi:hypothetical protein